MISVSFNSVVELQRVLFRFEKREENIHGNPIEGCYYKYLRNKKEEPCFFKVTLYKNFYLEKNNKNVP